MSLSSVAFFVTSSNLPLPVLRNRLLRADAGQQQIGVLIVVEVGHAAAERRPRLRQTRFRRDIDEAPIPVVAQQEIAYLTTLDHCARQEQVGPAVAVVVEHDHRRAETRTH